MFALKHLVTVNDAEKGDTIFWVFGRFWKVILVTLIFSGYGEQLFSVPYYTFIAVWFSKRD